METLKSNKNKIKERIEKYYNKIAYLEHQLIEIEKNINDYESTKIIESIELNTQQRKIVEADDKNILVIACPGSGKTHTLISRVIHLILNKSRTRINDFNYFH